MGNRYGLDAALDGLEYELRWTPISCRPERRRLIEYIASFEAEFKRVTGMDWKPKYQFATAQD